MPGSAALAGTGAVRAAVVRAAALASHASDRFLELMVFLSWGASLLARDFTACGTHSCRGGRKVSVLVKNRFTGKAGRVRA
ncbi:hypothetical protein Ssi02_22750 [Sinosporangium siamense]|uniref:Uncharacterized protein n=1 Tax=Sinosporangium siamense TaxID=1367973 RepID=A0A919VBE9_9ACTN|nr:hypothetical protein Ssi02_22750 [Sinosporangium siamense]